GFVSQFRHQAAGTRLLLRTADSLICMQLLAASAPLASSAAASDDLSAPPRFDCHLGTMASRKTRLAAQKTALRCFLPLCCILCASQRSKSFVVVSFVLLHDSSAALLETRLRRRILHCEWNTVWFCCVLST